MNKERRFVIVSGTAGVVGVLSGCTTFALLEDKNDDSGYNEQFSSVLITQDGKSIVVIGKHYHYVFDAPDNVVATLKSSFHEFVVGSFTDFIVDSDGNVKGKYSLEIDSTATQGARAEAIREGYVVNPYGVPKKYGDITGVRYDSGNIQASSSTQRLNKVYGVWVTVEQPKGKKRPEVLLTPVAMAIDGILMIALVPLVIFKLNTREKE